MKIFKHQKQIILDTKDNGVIVSVTDSRFGEYINIKVTYTDKGFGIQVFGEDFYNDVKRRRPLNIIVGERGDQVLYKDSYVAIWKLIPKFVKSLKRRFA